MKDNIKEKYEALKRLKENEDFAIIIKDYLFDSVSQLIFNEDLHSIDVVDRLNARKYFKEYINNIEIEYKRSISG